MGAAYPLCSVFRFARPALNKLGEALFAKVGVGTIVDATIAYSGERDRRFRLIVTGRHAC
jgi:hypothetical protein